MWINQALLFSSVLSVHTGFGLALAFLGILARKRGNVLRWILISATFFLLIYLPSCLVILGLKDLPIGLRALILTIGLIATILPLLKWRTLPGMLNPGRLWKIYPAVSMLLLAAWSLITFFHEGIASGAPLALSSTIAGMAALQRQYEAR